jgi:serine/threonine protein kinase
VSESLGAAASADPALVIKELVQQDKLSPYQANVLYRGLAHPLQLGKLRVTRSLEAERGANWYEGEDAAGARWSAFPPKSVWMVALPDEKLASREIQNWPPSLQWAQQHCQVQSPHLDRWTSAGATLKHLYAVCESVPGLLLSEMLQQGPLASKQAYRMLRDIAMGLKFLHLHRLVHGHLSTDAVVWSESRGFLLLRDPLFPPRSPYHAPTLSVLGGAQDRLALAAPELIHPEALPTIHSDLYALGCLWFRCLTGNWPVDPGPQATPEVWGKLHAQVPVVLPSRLPEVQKKCLLHLLAKDPSVRFSGIDPLLRALDQLVVAPTPESENVQAIGSNSLDTNSSDPKPTPAKPTPAKPISVKPVATDLKTSNPPSINPPSIKPETSKPTSTTPIAANSDTSKSSAADAGSTSKSPKTQAVKSKPVESKPEAVKRQIQKPTDEKQSPGSVPQAVSLSPGIQEPLAEKSGSNPTAVQTSELKKKGKKKRPQNKPFGPRKKAKKPAWFLPLIVACSLLFFALLLLLLRGNNQGIVTIQPKAETKSQTSSIVSNQPIPTTSNKGASAGPDPMLEYYNVKSEDTGVPWTPPTIGAPYSTEMLPAGLEALLLISPDCWTQSSPASKELVEWWKSVYSQGPDLSELPALASESLSSLSLAWYPGESTGSYRKVYRVGWKEPKSLEALVPSIGQWSAQEIQSDNKKYRYWTKEVQGKSIAMITDDFTSNGDQQVKRIAIGSWELLKPLLESQGKSGPLRRQLDGLLQSTDSRADMTFVAAPSFIFVDGKQMFGEHSEKVIGLMREVIDDRVQAILLRSHFEPQLYLEYRMLGSDLQSAPRDAIELKRKLETVAENVESQLAAQPAAAYWRAIANRFPQMLRTVHKYARSGAEDGQVVFNVYLPKEAIGNLAIGSWMALQGGAATGTAKVATAPKPNASAVKSVDDMLDAKISLRVEQESLEVVLQAIANELKESHTGGTEALPMAINGTAFQKDGITRNQQIRNFEFKDTSVREVLTALCRRANPVTTVQKANEKDQKVVWLVLDDPNTPSKKKLDMTTRAWSESNQVPLPKEFNE